VKVTLPAQFVIATGPRYRVTVVRTPPRQLD
jgi:hypothetical protein